MAVGNDMASGPEALAAGEWAKAREHFEREVAEHPTPASYENLGTACWWLDDVPAAMAARRQALAGFRAERDSCGAARVAIELAWDHTLAGNNAVARGWVERARKYVASCGSGSHTARLAILEAEFALFVDRDPVAAEAFAGQAMTCGADLGEVDVEMAGTAYAGLALVSQGRVGDGMRMLDEAVTAALSGEVEDPAAASLSCCALIYACERVYDYPRAAQWCQELRELSERWSYRLMLSLCRVHYAGVLIWRGQWEEAEEELLAALASLEATRPGQAAEALVTLGELRCQQGRFDEAARLFGRASTEPYQMYGGSLAMRGQAELVLERGDSATAATLSERYLRSLPVDNAMERSRGLEVLACASAATGALDEAERAQVELDQLGRRIGTEPILAAGCLVAGVIAAARDDHPAARRHFEDAVDHYRRGGAMYHVERARLLLAEQLAASGLAAQAAAEAHEAFRAGQASGAAHLADRAARLLRQHGAQVAASLPTGPAHLTPRETEILQLMARGLSNQAIADQLVISVRTVERHVGGVYGELGLTGPTARANATAFAMRHGLA